MIDLAVHSDKLSDDRLVIFSDGVRVVKAVVILACLIGISQPAGAQSLFAAFGGDDEASATPEQKWRRTVARQIHERAPVFMNLGRGRVTVDFRVDRAGRVTNIKFDHYSSNAHALIVASMISSLRLPPPPKTVGRDCCWLRQGVQFR